ncbi:hypothetical protein [Chelativorans salis]|uniref:Uncharacterized protein n=1 Tax=Chelativorans salis TaxID=2978478 RepID=A0ABT2LUH4_9HYPH|nr:hypothetical protein [Chelativorans sp. EGI FJ00035]MCT7378180.1 hypothetical protein [Chelativorans sp. EGI FJ00035]
MSDETGKRWSDAGSGTRECWLEAAQEFHDIIEAPSWRTHLQAGTIH